MRDIGLEPVDYSKRSEETVREIKALLGDIASISEAMIGEVKYRELRERYRMGGAHEE